MSFKFLTHVILRCPRLSYKNYNPGHVSDLLADDGFHTAIFLSSKAFYNALKAKNFELNLLNDREKLTLQNYYNRISFRTTPFGAFSSFAYTHWSEDDAIHLDNTKLHLLPDQQYLQLLKKYAGNQITDEIKYLVNPTIYKLGQNYRFVKTIVPAAGTAYEYSLQTFRSTNLFAKMISVFGNKQISLSALQYYLIKQTGCTMEEADGFIAFLDDSQIILKDNLPGVLGKRVNTSSVMLNTAVSKELPGLEEVAGLENRLKEMLPKEHQHKMANCCYVNLQRFTAQGINISYQKKLARVIDAAKALMVPASNDALKNFAEKFERRFEKRAIPLLQALDPITGVSYGESSSDKGYSSLLDRIDFKQDKPTNPHIEWTPVHNLFLKKMMASPGKVIQITDADIQSINSGKKVIYPASFSVVFNIANDTIIMDGMGGVSANALIGRFTPFNKQFLASATEVAKLEAQHNPGVIFAEINHLSDSHVDNINRRCPVYEYEIPINATPVNGLKQIALNDLLVRVIDGEVILESVTLKKRVIPRLTSAYNYRRNDLSLFRFLSDLQYQNIGYDFDISVEKLFPEQDFYPRVEYHGTILSLAKWVLKKEQIKEISGHTTDKNLVALKDFCERYHIPTDVSMGFSDKQLYFNLSDMEQAKLFIENIKADEKAIIKEFIRPDTTVVNQNGKPLINQFVAFLVNPEITYRSHLDGSDKKLKDRSRDFSLGSEWLYLKIYCSPLIANDLIINKIVPLMTKIAGKQADKWFFVRYYDNGHHIRLRVHAIANSLGDILKQIHSALASSVNFQLIREYQADTYRREVERYGETYMETIETVSYKSSVAVSAYLKIHNRNPTLYPYYAYAFLSVMRLLKNFMPDIKERMEYTDMIAANFIAEFKGGKELKLGLDKKYREVEQELSAITASADFFNPPSLKQKQLQFEQAFTGLLAEVKQEPLSRRKQLVADVVHMHLNRAFTEQQRHHELVVYYCINKKLRSEFARTIKQNKAETV